MLTALDIVLFVDGVIMCLLLCLLAPSDQQNKAPVECCIWLWAGVCECGNGHWACTGRDVTSTVLLRWGLPVWDCC